MDAFLFGKIFPTGFSMHAAPWLMIPPRFTASPNAVPMITAKITAGIFFIRPMELTPIPMEQTPKIFVSSELILVGSLCPNKAPTTPPLATDRALMIIPTGIHLSPLQKGMCLGTFVRLAQLLATTYIFAQVTQTTAVQRSPCTAELTVRYLILAQSTVQRKHFTSQKCM